MKKHTKASAPPHVTDKKDRIPRPGAESVNDRARFLKNAAVALEVPDEVSNRPGATREEFVRHARLLLHYRQN